MESFDWNKTDIASEILFAAVRSRGPGGQNVNKVSSAAILYWPYDQSAYLTMEQKARVRQKLQSYINKEEQIYLRSDEFRDLERNKARCLEKLQLLLQQAFHQPKKRKATKPTRGSKERKLAAKNRRGEIKKSRQRVQY